MPSGPSTMASGAREAKKAGKRAAGVKEAKTAEPQTISCGVWALRLAEEELRKSLEEKAARADSSEVESDWSEVEEEEGSRWPLGWTQAGTVTAKAIDTKSVTHETLQKMTDITTEMLGGEVEWTSPRDEHAQYFKASIMTNNCDKIFVAVTKRASKSPAFKELGARMYFKGVAENQKRSEHVKRWLEELTDLTL